MCMLWKNLVSCVELAPTEQQTDLASVLILSVFAGLYILLHLPSTVFIEDVAYSFFKFVVSFICLVKNRIIELLCNFWIPSNHG